MGVYQDKVSIVFGWSCGLNKTLGTMKKKKRFKYICQMYYLKKYDILKIYFSNGKKTI